MNNQVMYPFLKFQVNLLIFQNPYEFLLFFYVYENNVKKIEATSITVQLLVKLSGKFLCVICNFFTKTYPKFVTLHLFWKMFKNVKTICYNFMDSENQLI